MEGISLTKSVTLHRWILLSKAKRLELDCAGRGVTKIRMFRDPTVINSHSSTPTTLASDKASTAEWIAQLRNELYDTRTKHPSSCAAPPGQRILLQSSQVARFSVLGIERKTGTAGRNKAVVAVGRLPQGLAVGRSERIAYGAREASQREFPALRSRAVTRRMTMSTVSDQGASDSLERGG
jgi:hypothetical protein